MLHICGLGYNRHWCFIARIVDTFETGCCHGVALDLLDPL